MKILLTGGTRGIGRAIFDELKSAHDVYVTARNEETLKQMGAKGYIACDLSKDIEVLCDYIKDNEFESMMEDNKNIIGTLVNIIKTAKN
jgi:short-subunit dehydrogenase